MEKMFRSPASFSQQQMIRLLHNRQWKTNGVQEIAIHASPFPDNRGSDICQLRQSGQSIELISRKSSLSSGNAVIPPYLQELLIAKYHDDEFDFHDFLNILNHVFFHIEYRVWEYSKLLTKVESDHRLHHAATRNSAVYPSLMSVIPLICGSGVSERHEKWLQYSIIFGLKSRSIPELARILRDYFSIHLTIKAKHLQQRLLPASEQSFLSSRPQDQCYANNNMNGGMVLGKMIWLVHQSLYITLFPETPVRLKYLLKHEDWKCEMEEMVRFYLKDKTELIIQTRAPEHWYDRQPISADRAATVQLGRGFNLAGRLRSGRPLITVHYRSKE